DAINHINNVPSFYIEDNITHYELHLRTWMSILERVYHSAAVLRPKFLERLLNNLSEFTK
ncbi:9867_t:CDS:1, partial [Gigaspora rosea]